jgi:hypothetical protein
MCEVVVPRPAELLALFSASVNPFIVGPKFVWHYRTNILSIHCNTCYFLPLEWHRPTCKTTFSVNCWTIIFINNVFPTDVNPRLLRLSCFCKFYYPTVSGKTMTTHVSSLNGEGGYDKRQVTFYIARTHTFLVTSLIHCSSYLSWSYSRGR